MTSGRGVRSGSERPRGNQQPTLLSLPAFDSTAQGQDAVALARAAGLYLDEWQAFVLSRGLAENGPSKWAAFEVATIVSRQNGKGSIIEARELAGLFLLPEDLIIHSAHEFKGIDLDMPVLTTSGWTTMGGLQDGDEVFAPDGQPTKVIAAHPVRYGRPCFRLTFDDGQAVIADDEHLWAVTEDSVRRVLSTQQIADEGVSVTAARTGRDRRTYRFRVDLPAPLVGRDMRLPVPPWLLGAWLGDGTTAKGDLTVGARDLDYVLGRLHELGESWRVRPDRRWPDRVVTVIVDGLAERLRRAGVLGAKHIPVEYMLASVAQRRALLAGVMDTDGGVSAHQVAVTFTNTRLADDVASLVRSLGYKASLRTFRASLRGVDAGPMFRVQFTAATAISPFEMPRKKSLLRPRQSRTTRAHYNAIVRIEPVESRPTRCITVAHESATYLVGNGFIPTHNTAAEAFLRIENLIEGCPQLDREVLRIRRSHGEEAIELRSGKRLKFLARTRGSGRGFTGDCVILDEAQNLGHENMAALLPTLSTRSNAQVWYFATAGTPESIQLGLVRSRALGGDDPSLAFFEWSAEAGDDHASLDTWAKANPNMNAPGHGITHEYIAKERLALAPHIFARERLGIGDYPTDKAAAWAVIGQDAWSLCQDSRSRIEDDVAFAVDVTPDRSSAVIAVAGYRPDGLLHVEVIQREAGTAWVVREMTRLADRYDPAATVVDPSGPAGSLIAELEAAGVAVTQPTARDAAQACGQLYDAVTHTKSLRHLGQDSLTAAVAGAERRKVSDAWCWDRKALTVDLSPLVAATLAAWGLDEGSLGPDDVGIY